MESALLLIQITLVLHEVILNFAVYKAARHCIWCWVDIVVFIENSTADISWAAKGRIDAYSCSRAIKKSSITGI